MTDIARQAGCSQATVSIVLNDTPGIHISDETRERVREAAQRLSYRPQSRKSRRGTDSPPRPVAILFDQIVSSPEPVQSMEGARQEAWKSGYVVAAYQTDNDPVFEPQTINTVLDMGAVAIIYAAVMTREVAVPPELYDPGVPVVLLNCFTGDRHFPAVVPSEVAGGRTATGTLIEAGHRRIAHITGESWMDAAKDRLRGYRQALEAADIPSDPALVREGDWSTSAGYEQTLVLMALPDPPTAIFCSNDRMAIGCYEALKELGLRIPQDVSVVGYDDEEVARHLNPPLTTLVLPHRAMGRWAVDKALSMVGTATARHHLVKLECPLIERHSVAAPGKAKG
ncbi:MAG: LacI family DNA-binding transcriptional regulator [Rhodobiaceae bacterium]|nr:LacI family DNA-binding transcriptional regulator [Rhodobiaceae bacterium]